MFISSLFLYSFSYSAEISTQVTSEFESNLIFGNTTAVNDNFTVGVNGSLIVSLALIETNNTDQTTQEDAIHYMSVVCPIRSPVVVLPVINSTNALEFNKSANMTSEIEGIVYCQANNSSDTSSTKSINEQLLDANLATLDNTNCNSQTVAFSNLSRLGDC
jgi:hypothetical protein